MHHKNRVAWIVRISLICFLIGPMPCFHVAGSEAGLQDPSNLGDRPVLIASQFSKFKSAVVTAVVAQFEADSIPFEKVSIYDLPKIDEKEWSVIVIIHAWEFFQAHRSVREFLKNSENLDRVVVFTTSGDGDITVKGVDGISAASRMEDLPQQVERIVYKVKEVLNP